MRRRFEGLGRCLTARRHGSEVERRGMKSESSRLRCWLCQTLQPSSKTSSSIDKAPSRRGQQ